MIQMLIIYYIYIVSHKIPMFHGYPELPADNQRVLLGNTPFRILDIPASHGSHGNAEGFQENHMTTAGVGR